MKHQTDRPPFSRPRFCTKLEDGHVFPECEMSSLQRANVFPNTPGYRQAPQFLCKAPGRAVSHFPMSMHGSAFCQDSRALTETKKRLKPRPGGFSPGLFPNGWNFFALSPILPFPIIPISPAPRMLNRLQGVFSSFQNHDVRNLVIWGIAAVLYGVPRATFDVDILIEAPGNAQRLLDALEEAASPQHR